MIKRRLTPILTQRLKESSSIMLIGPRQVGKTTLALELSSHIPTIYLDLESEKDKAKLSEPELYFSGHENELIILDEVHRLPGLFPLLRGIIDQGRRQEKETGRFLLLGSASLELLKQSSETLAGRMSYLELCPIDAWEINPVDTDLLWIRGGFPNSFLSLSATQSLRWRLDFIRSYLERDIPQFGPRIPAETLRRFWTMLAHHHSGLLNTAQFAAGLGVSGRTAAHYLDLMVDLLLVRRLQPWHLNTGKRLIRSPKVYIRDTGILHALLGISDKEALLGHPIAGPSWEGFIIEALLSIMPEGTQASFYRTSAGAEIDLILSFINGDIWAIEIKRTLSPKIPKGFYLACQDINPTKSYIVYSGEEHYKLEKSIEAINFYKLGQELLKLN